MVHHSRFFRAGKGRARTARLMTAAGLALLLGMVLMVAACGSNGENVATTANEGDTTLTGGPPPAGEVQVVMSGRAFDPATITVQVGDTVTWLNQDTPHHDVVADNGEFRSELFASGETFSFTFATAGTFPYHCSVHPGMTGTVLVE